MKRSLSERFWARVAVAGPGECWLWQGALNKGYGEIRDEDNRALRPHRVAYELIVDQRRKREAAREIRFRKQRGG